MNIFYRFDQIIDSRDGVTMELADEIETYIFTDYNELMDNDEIICIEYSNARGIFVDIKIDLFKKLNMKRENFDKIEDYRQFRWAELFDNVFEGRTIIA